MLPPLQDPLPPAAVVAVLSPFESLPHATATRPSAMTAAVTFNFLLSIRSPLLLEANSSGVGHDHVHHDGPDSLEWADCNTGLSQSSVAPRAVRQWPALRYRRGAAE